TSKAQHSPSICQYSIRFLSKQTGSCLLIVSMPKTVEISGVESRMRGYTYSCAEESTGAVLQTTLR
ncbi:MAG TPA: hypothetical protein VFQ36_22535, partial [Ktedonobacteraceae bacterium]|nr:hypothetical protein [Ktedonobacteraceae bacterium]